MQRRTLLKLGLVGAALVGGAGLLLKQVVPARTQGLLSAGARAMVDALATAVLHTTLPAEAGERRKALDGLHKRLEDTIRGLPQHLQQELDELLTIAASSPGRLALFGLGAGWSEATPAAVTAALQGMRESSLALKQQAYHALRDILNAAYFADASAWRALGYPGQRPVPGPEAAA